MASVAITAEAREQFRLLPTRIKVRVMKVFERLAAWPKVSGAKPLRGALKGHFRVRTGDYRVQFLVSDGAEVTVVTVVKVGHRDGFYDE